MGCLKILHSEQKSALSKSWKIFVGGVEKSVSSEKNRINYYPFGMQQPGRSYSSSSYRYGFNGKEMDNEVAGTGNQYDYGFRIYNPRIGKFLSVDPLTKSYPWYTPYQFAGNTPIQAIDLDGLEEYIVVHWMDGDTKVGTSIFKLPNSWKVEKDSKEIVYLTMDVENIFNTEEPYAKEIVRLSGPRLKNLMSRNNSDWKPEFDYDEDQMVNNQGLKEMANIEGMQDEYNAFTNSGFIMDINEPNPNKVIFETNESILTTEGKEELNLLVIKMILIPDMKMELVGHTDNVGSDVNNQKLSLARANSSMDYLISQGVSADRLSASGQGASQPVGDNSTEQGKSENRRIEFKQTNE